MKCPRAPPLPLSLFHPSSLAAHGTGLIQPPHGTSFDGAKKKGESKYKDENIALY